MGLAGDVAPVSAYPAEVRVASEAFHEVLDVGYLEELAEHQGFQVPFGVVFDGSAWAVFVEVCPEDGLDRC